ncbi:MAG: phosphonatase-like hydrolase [Gemmataceae bacterium]
MIELVVFDLAGTTVYDGDAVNSCFRAALAARGVQADPAVVNTVMGLHKPEAIRILLERFGRPHGASPSPEQVKAIHEDFTCRMRDYYADDPAVREIPGASASFAALRRAGIKVALNTGFSRSIADVLLARLGWRSPMVIDADVTSDEVPRGRPHPDMIRHLMTRLRVQDPSRIAKVGDTKADLEEGSNAGCGLVIGVATGSFSRTQLQACPHTHILESVAEVPALLFSDVGIRLETS